MGLRQGEDTEYMNSKYDKIISLPHHVSKTRPQMPMSDRAAQFAPFAALTGYDTAISEKGRQVTEMMDNTTGYIKDEMWEQQSSEL